VKVFLIGEDSSEIATVNEKKSKGPQIPHRVKVAQVDYNCSPSFLAIVFIIMFVASLGKTTGTVICHDNLEESQRRCLESDIDRERHQR